MANWDLNVTVDVLAAALGVDVSSFNLINYMTDGATFADVLYRLYESNTAVQADTDLDADAKAAGADFFAQERRPKVLMISRKFTDEAQIDTYTVGGTWAENDVGRIAVTPFLGSLITGEFTALATPTPSDVAAGLRADLTTKLAAEDITVSGATTQVILTSDIAGQPFSSAVGTLSTDAGTITKAATNPNVNFATCLSDLLLVKSDWFGLVIDSRANADLWYASEWAESNEKLYVAQTDESACKTWAAGNIFELIEDTSRRFTSMCWHHDDAERFDLCWLTDFLSHDPDKTSTIAAYRNLTNVTVDPEADLDDTAKTLMAITHNVNLYLPFKGTPIAFPGHVADGNFMDAVVAYCWLEARITEALAQLMVDVVALNSKAPYDNDGIVQIAGVIKPILLKGEGLRHIRKGSTALVIPAIEDIPSADITARELNELSGSCTLAGAIQETHFTVSVASA